MNFRYETAGLVAVTRSMDIAVAYVIQVLIQVQVSSLILEWLSVIWTMLTWLWWFQ